MTIVDTVSTQLETIANNIPRVYNAGYEKGKSEGGGISEDAFWDEYQSNGERADYSFAFAGKGWNDKTYNPKYPINYTDECTNMYYLSLITDTKIPIKFSGTYLKDVFAARYLKTIREITVDKGCSYTNCFAYAYELETITFSENSEIGNDISFADCSKLNHISIENIIARLSDTTTEKSCLFNLQALLVYWEGNFPGILDSSWAQLTATNWYIDYA